MQQTRNETKLQNVLKQLSEMDATTIDEIVRQRLPTADGADACDWLTARLQEDARLQPKPFGAGSDPELAATRLMYEAPQNAMSRECWLLINKQEGQPELRHGPVDLSDAQTKLFEIQGRDKDPYPDGVCTVDRVLELGLLDRLSLAAQTWAERKIKVGIWPEGEIDTAADTYRDLLEEVITAADAYLTWARD